VRAIVYTWSSCGFCARAKDLLTQHGVDFREVSLDGRREELRRLQELCGKKTVPLVLLDGEWFGGLEELESLVTSGRLTPRD